MKIKKFTGKSFQEAFDHVKNEMGANAVILNSRKIKNGGMLDFLSSSETYEITAAMDAGKNQNQPAPSTHKLEQMYRSQSSSKNSGNRSATGHGNGSSGTTFEMQQRLSHQTQEIKLLQDELKDVKQVLNQVSDFLKYTRMPALPDLFKTTLKKLVDNEVHEDLSKAIVQTVYSQTNASDYKNKTAVINNLTVLLKRMIKVADPLEQAKRSPYVVALVGPTGVGKTTTVAKLAANLKLYNKKKVALISADTYRIGAIEQLQTFANIASIPMNVVYSPDDMRGAISKFRESDIILIDTVGRSQKNKEHLTNLSQFVESANPDEVHLVLSITAGFNNLLDIIRRFNLMRPNRFIFTKLDEAIHTGNILNMLYKHQLPVSYLTTGQVVPNDITNAEKSTVANLIYKGVMN